MQLTYFGPGLDLIPIYLGQNFNDDTSEMSSSIKEAYDYYGSLKKNNYTNTILKDYYNY